MTDNAAGSYDFGNFDQNQNELARLKRQAAIVSELEVQVLRNAGLKPGMRVLDLACGPGIVSVLLAEAVAPAEVIGVDLSESLLDEARAYAASRSASNVRFQQGNVYSLDDSLGQFDFIYTRFLFQHLADPENALRVIRFGEKYRSVSSLPSKKRSDVQKLPREIAMDEQQIHR